MPKERNLTEAYEKRIIELYKGQEETLESAAIKASRELGEKITLGCVYWLLKKNGIPRKKKGRSGKSHEGHFHGNRNQIHYSSLTEEMINDVIYWFNQFGSNISAYRKVNDSFKEKYEKRLIYPIFEEILTRSGVDVHLEAYRRG